MISTILLVSAAAPPQLLPLDRNYPLDVTFGDRLRLIGYDIVDNAKWRRTELPFLLGGASSR